MMTARSNHYTEEHRRLSAAGALTRKPAVAAQAVALSWDEEARGERRDYPRTYVYLAAGLSLVAAQIHAWAMPEHFAEQPATGLFFLLVAVGQGAYAAALLDRPRSAPLLASGLGATIGLLLLLLVAHTVGLPLVGLDGQGHIHAEAAEAFDPLAMVALVVEAGLILALAVLLRGRSNSKRGR